MKFQICIFLFVSNLLFLINLTAQTPELVIDINPGAADGLSQFNKSFARIGQTVFFTADNGIHGPELYIEFNGSVSLVKDINPGPTGSNPLILAVYKNRIYFNANDGVHGPELWVSDGTEDGTTLFYEGIQGANGAFFTKAIVGANNSLYFASSNALYISTGTPESTVRINCPHEMQLSEGGNGSHDRLIPFENGVAFAARSADSVFVYKTVGTLAISLAVTKVLKASAFSSIAGMAAANDRIMFILDNFNENVLYSTTGNSGSIAQKYSNPAGNDLLAFRFIPFRSNMVLLLTTNRLYGLNGISTQTINLGPYNTSFTQGVPVPSAVLDGKAYFSLGSFGDVKIYETNGTLAGTKVYHSSPDLTFGEMVSYGGSIIFTTGINNNFVPKIYQFESNDLNPQIIHSFTANSTNGPSVQILGFNGNQMYFSSNLGSIGRELYKLRVDVNVSNKDVLISDIPYAIIPAGDRSFRIENAGLYDLLELQLIDLQGKLIWSQHVSGNNSFQLPDLQGIYILHVAGSEGEKVFKVPVWR